MGSTDWGTATTLATNATSYTDTVVQGTLYEYQLEIATAGFTNYYGYLAAGVDVPHVEGRGTIVLIVDNSQAAALAPELEDLRRDLVSDGWKVIRHDVPRMATNPADTGTGPGAARLAELSAVKNLIVAAYNADPTNVRHVFLIGRIPLAYSGNTAPDGHWDHNGAWPTDMYYGDVNGLFTDSSVNNTSASDPRNRNIPADGKFDQNTIPAGGLELAVGRVDFSNMNKFPSAGATETDLLRRYLRKAHDYRHKRGAYAAIERRAIAVPWGDYAKGAFTTVYATVGRGIAKIDQPAYPGEVSPWFRWMEENPAHNYLMGFGQGPGNFEGAANVGSSQDFGMRPSRAVFTSYFGSYFGDWDSPNNFLRASLAGNALGTSLGLCAIWSGRPHFFLHPMSMGETLGAAARVSQHNSNQYLPESVWGRGIHAGLMGDPALRLYAVAPPRNLRATSSAGTITLTWDPTDEPDALGYLVYSAETPDSIFAKRTPTPQASPTFTDSVAPGLTRTYYVRTVRKETTPGGSFVNASVGSWITVTSSASPVPNPPTGLTASITSSTQATVTWNDNSSDETGFRVERRNGPSGSFLTIASLPANTTTFNDPGPFTAGMVYYYRVVALGSGGDSANSQTASADAAVGYLSPAVAVLSIDRAAGSAQIAISRLAGGVGAVGVSYSTANGSALAGQHYTATSGTLSWADGEVGNKIISIPLLGGAADSPRTLKLNLSNPTGGVTLSQVSSVKIMLYDSGAPVTSPWISTILDSVGDAGYVSQLAGGTEFGSLLFGGNWSNSYERGRFIYRSITGDQTVTVRIETPIPANQWNPGTFALCVREKLDQTGRMAAVYVSDPGTSGGVKFATRSGDWVSSSILPTTANTIQTPCWFRVTRTGNTFVGEVSTDGTNWTVLGSNTIPGMPATALWGIFQCSNLYLGDHQLARFTNISFQTPLPPSAPENLSVRGVAPSTIRVSWTPPAGANSITLERSLDGGDFAPLALLTGTANSFDDTLSGAVNTYTYRVRASNTVGHSDWAVAAPYVPRPELQVVSVDISGGNGDAIVDRNEAPNLSITIANLGVVPATGVTATLVSSIPGVTVLESTKAYGDLAIGASSASATPFVIDIAPDLAPGTILSLNLTISSGQGTFTRSVVVPLSEPGWKKYVTSTAATITPGTTNIGNSGDDVVTNLSLPFPFNFRGTNYTSVRASSNGNLQFTTSVGNFGNGPLPDQYLGVAALVFWDDLTTSGDGRGIFTSVSGTAPNRIFNIEWRAGVLNAGNVTVNFQARLYENSSRIDFVYGSMGNNGNGATVGVQDDAASAAVQHSLNSGVITEGLQLTFIYSSGTPMGPGRPDSDGDGIPDWWTVTHFGSRVGNAASNSRAKDSPSGDGMGNLVKYALGLNPWVSGSAGRLDFQLAGNHLNFSYSRPEPAPPGLVYRVESSSDLVNWTTSGNTEISSVVSGGLRTITIQDGQSTSSASKRFMRLRVEPGP